MALRRMALTKILDEVGPFRFFAWFIVFFLLAGLLAKGMTALTTGSHGDKILGSIVVGAVAAILIGTVKKWAKWIWVACLVNAFKLGLMAFLWLLVPSKTGISFLGIASLLAAMSFLTLRFVNGVPNQLDSFCLVGAVLAIVHSLVGTTPIWSASVAFVLLLVAFAVDRVSRKGSARENDVEQEGLTAKDAENFH